MQPASLVYRQLSNGRNARLFPARICDNSLSHQIEALPL
jgi:hypothetical protein